MILNPKFKNGTENTLSDRMDADSFIADRMLAGYGFDHPISLTSANVTTVTVSEIAGVVMAFPTTATGVTSPPVSLGGQFMRPQFRRPMVTGSLNLAS